MFTGIVQDVGTVRVLDPSEGALSLTVDTALDLSRASVGDSIAVAGVCLTIVALEPGAFSAEVSRETLGLTTLGGWRVGQRVNLEPALRLGDALGGHLMAGHVDGLAVLVNGTPEGSSRRLRLQAPAGVARYLARKGSVALDGVSLTVNAVHGREFEVNLIPHTLRVTTLDSLRAGDRVNLEVDLIARYVDRRHEAAAESPKAGDSNLPG
jgi:riboflavin synthase